MNLINSHEHFGFTSNGETGVITLFLLEYPLNGVKSMPRKLARNAKLGTFHTHSPIGYKLWLNFKAGLTTEAPNATLWDMDRRGIVVSPQAR